MSITVPPEVGSSAGSTQKNVFDSAFLPDWMYLHPKWFHEQRLEIDIDRAIKQVASLRDSSSIVDKWKHLPGSNTERFDDPPNLVVFPYRVADAGTKKGADNNDMSDQRHLRVRWFWKAKDVYNRLLESRTMDHAKKRVIELASRDIRVGLICWLTAPQVEKQLFLEFLRRHQSSESLFGERVDWNGNIWDTDSISGSINCLARITTISSLLIWIIKVVSVLLWRCPGFQHRQTQHHQTVAT